MHLGALTSMKLLAFPRIGARPPGMGGGLFRSRFGGLYAYGMVFVGVSFLLRTALMADAAGVADLTPLVVAKVYLAGLLFDVVTCLACVAPFALLLGLLPERVYHWRFVRWALWAGYAGLLTATLFDVAAEWLFWQEFGSRFNFIAVDYLVYTHEVVGNVWESYPVPAILAGIGLATGGLVWLTRPLCRAALAARSRGGKRWALVIAHLLLPAVLLVLVSPALCDVSDNRYANELARNGFYSLVQAFRDNTLDYHAFYRDEPADQAFARLREMLGADVGTFVSADPRDIRRQITCDGPERRWNVVIVLSESLSAEFLGAFGNREGLTPNLDALCEQGILFRNFYATGTRTTRGMEAVVLSLPPTPGRSLVKRPDNEGLFSLGTLFRRRGYRTAFLYGGYGYFDNMNHFFGNNGFDVIDRADFADDEITFTNAWGVCDDDLYGRACKEADAANAAGRPFCLFLMTTSNHRPYTYPQTIDIPSGTGRSGAVNYADHALGGFLEAARARPWFDQTVFVIVADHCANSAGKTAVPVARYHIPLLIYAPKLLTPRKVDDLACQIDVAPTLLGLLRFTYVSKFFGADVLATPPRRALLGTYQKLGLLTDDGRLTLLSPNRSVQAFRVGADGRQRPCAPDADAVRDVISYYQTAADLVAQGRQGADR